MRDAMLMLELHWLAVVGLGSRVSRLIVRSVKLNPFSEVLHEHIEAIGLVDLALAGREG